MRKFPKVANRPPLGVCTCVPGLRVCPVCESKEEDLPECPDAPVRSLECPWNEEDLPEHLRGLGHRGADQDGYDGEEWVTPEEEHSRIMVEAVRVVFEAEIIEGR